MYQLKLIGECHEDPAPYAFLSEHVQTLYEQGYKTLYLEMPHSYVKFSDSVDGVINRNQISLDVVKYFPSGKLPLEERLTEQQKKIVGSIVRMLLSKNNFRALSDWIRQQYAFHENRKEYLEARIQFLKQAEQLGMHLVSFDVDMPLNYQGAGGQERNLEMFKRIKQGLEKSEHSKGILITGVSHFLDVFQAGFYQQGLIRLMINDENFAISRAFFIVSAESALVAEVKERIKACSPQIISMIEVCNTSASPEKQRLSTNMLTEQKRVSVSPAEVLANPNYYLVCRARDNEGHNQQTAAYLEDLGGKLINQQEQQGHSLFVWRLPSDVLKKSRRTILGLERYKVTPVTPKGIEALLNINGMLIEVCALSSGRDRLLLTFWKGPERYNEQVLLKIRTIIDEHRLRSLEQSHIASYQDDIKALYDKGVECLVKADYCRAIQFLTQYIAHLKRYVTAPDNTFEHESKKHFLRGYLQLGFAYASVGNYVDAKSNYCEAMKLDLPSAGVHCFYAEVLRIEGAVADAQREYDQAIKIDCNHIHARLFRARFLERQGDVRAKEDFEVLVKTFSTKQPSNKFEKGMYARACLSVGRRDDEAISDFLAQDEDNIYLCELQVEMLFLLHKQRGNRGNLNNALQILNKCVLYHPTFVDAYWLRGLIYQEQGKPELAKQDFQTVKQRVPKYFGLDSEALECNQRAQQTSAPQTIIDSDEENPDGLSSDWGEEQAATISGDEEESMQSAREREQVSARAMIVRRGLAVESGALSVPSSDATEVQHGI